MRGGLPEIWERGGPRGLVWEVRWGGGVDDWDLGMDVLTILVVLEGSMQGRDDMLSE